MTAETRLVLIRHAEAVANTTGILGGHVGCAGLTEPGRRQAEALRDRLALAGLPADTPVLSSRLARAVQTAEILLGGGPRELEQRCELCDVHWGELDGSPSSDLDPGLGPYDRVARGGESWFGFERRCRRALLGLAREFAGRTVVVVTHGGIVKSSLTVFGGVDGQVAAESQPAYTGVTTWVGGSGGWRLAGYDDHSHLAAGAGTDGCR